MKLFRRPARFLNVAFIDVVDSVGLYRRLGDRKANRRVDQTLAHAARSLARHGGRVIKINGDGLMCAFSAAEQAFDALLEAQHSTTLALRIGAHAGPVLLKRGDAFGNAVNIAARLAGFAGAQQIVISAAVRDQLSGERQAACRRFDRVRIRGTGAEFQLYQVSVPSESVTALVTQVVEVPNQKTLVLRAGANEVRLIGGDAELVLGRDPSCGLVIDDPRASRFHATVEQRRGQFVLRDHSTNGSFVLDVDRSRPAFIRREEWVLANMGHLSFGQPISVLARSPETSRPDEPGAEVHPVEYRLA